jgi:CP family cyanate transporter-like MFS transporter
MTASKHTYRLWPIVVALMLVSLNLRPILAAIGPLLDEIQHTTGLGSALAGLLTTLPVFAMGVGALFGARLQALLGEYKGVMIGVEAIALACALRWFLPSTTGLIVTAVIAGLGISLVQALLPAYIKHHFPARVGLLMGLYTTGIMGGAALAAASASPLTDTVGSWASTFALWSIPAVLGALIWSQTATPAVEHAANRPVRLPLRAGRAWLLMVAFGIGTGAYTLVLAWLPPFYIQLGWSAAESGYLLGALTVMEVVAGLAVSMFISHFPDRRIPLLSVLLLILMGLAGLVTAPIMMAVPAAVLLGTGIGALFPLSLIVTMDHVSDARTAGALMGFVQGGGYIIASGMPFLAGLIREHSTDLSQAWLLMAFGIVVLMAMVTRLAPFTRFEADAWQLQPQ